MLRSAINGTNLVDLTNEVLASGNPLFTESVIFPFYPTTSIISTVAAADCKILLCNEKLFGVFGYDGFGYVVGYVGVVVEFHAGAGTTLGGAAEVGSVAEHFT